MDPETYRRIERIFHAARVLDADRRDALLERECSSAPELREQVEALLSSDAIRSEVLPDSSPRRIGPYEVREILGEGGMGVVYLARQRSPLERDVAVKVIKQGMDTREVLARFELERQALALMSHSNIARVYDTGVTEDGRPYLVMEYVDGEPVDLFCDRRRLTLRQRLDLFRSVCEGVQHAHQRAITHRDLKPSNVLVTEVDGRPVPKIIDFGIAKAMSQGLTGGTLLTERGRWIGTPEYMSPEQIDSSRDGVDTRSDVYALGVLLYQLLVGSLPFDFRRAGTSSLAEIQRAICEEEPPPPSGRLALECEEVREIARRRGTEPAALQRRVRGDLDWITLKALEKDPARRYASVSELAADLQRHFDHKPVIAKPPTLTYRLRKLVRRHRGWISAVSAAVLALAIGLAAALVQYREAEDARVEALSAWKAEARRAEEIERTSRALERALQEKGRALLRSEGLRLTNQSVALRDDNPGPAFLLAIEGARRHGGLQANNSLRAALESFAPQTILNGHEDWVVHAELSPDGRRVVSASQDGFARLWDVDSKDLLAVFPHEELVGCARFSPDGTRVVTVSSDRTAKVWDLQQRVLERILRLGSAGRHAAFSPDGLRLAVALASARAEVYDVRTGRRTSVLVGHSDTVYTVDFGPEGRELVTASRDGTARVWEAATGRELHVLGGHGDLVVAALFSPRGDRVATVSRDGFVRIWDATTGDLRCRSGPSSRSAGVCGAFSRDGRRVAAGFSGGEVRVVDGDEERTVAEIQGHEGPTTSVAFRPDGAWLISTGYDKAARAWHPETGKLLQSLTGHENRVNWAHFDDGGTRLVTASWDRTVRVWDVASPPPTRALGGGSDPIVGLAFAPGGSSAATVSESGAVCLRAVGTWQVTRTLRSPPTEARWTRFSADGDALVVGARDGSSEIYDSRAGVRLGSLGGNGSPVTAAAVDRRARQALIGHADGAARYWDWGIDRPVVILDGAKAPVRSVALDARRRIGIVVAPKSATVWDLSEASPRRTVDARAFVGQLVAASPSADRIAYVHRGAVVVTPVDASAPDLFIGDPEDRVISVAFSADGALLATGGHDWNVRVWNARTGAPVSVSRGHLASVQSVHFGDSETLATFSTDRTIRVWHTATGRERLTIPLSTRAVRQVELTPDGAWVVAVGRSGVLGAWPVEPLALARELAPRRLTPQELEHHEIGSAEERAAYRLEWDVERTLRSLRDLELATRWDPTAVQARRNGAERLEELRQLAGRDRSGRAKEALARFEGVFGETGEGSVVSSSEGRVTHGAP